MGLLVDPAYTAAIVNSSLWAVLVVTMVQLAFCIRIISQKEGRYGVATSYSGNE